MNTDKEIELNGVAYIRKDAASPSSPAPSLDGLPYVCIRTYSAGVHIGYLKSREGKEVVLLNSRRIWQWVGASELCQLSQEGVKSPEKCRFSMEVPSVTLMEAIEILPISAAAKSIFDGVKPWKQ